MSDNIFRWISFYITSIKSEYDYFYNTIVPMYESLNKSTIKNVEVDILFVGRSKSNKELLELAIFYVRDKAPFFTKETIVEDISIEDMIVRLTTYQPKIYNGIILSAHANGITVGIDTCPIIEIVEFAKLCERYIVTKKKLDYIIFDSCYMGSIESLYEFAHLCKYMLATPSYHDAGRTMIESPQLYIRYTDTLIWLSMIANWYIMQSESYAAKRTSIIQWVIYSSEDLIKLTDYLTKSDLYEKFVYKESAVIYFNKEDKYYHDENLYSISNVLDDTLIEHPELKKKIDHAKLLLLKSYHYYCKAEGQKFESSVLAIHNGLPDYLSNTFNCKLKIFAKTYCMREDVKLIEI